MPTESLKLYEINDAFRLLMEEVANNGGEMTAEQEAFQDGIAAQMAGKFESICRIRQEKICRAAAIDIEIKRLAEMKQVELNGAERLKDLMKRSLELTGETSVKTDLFTVRIQNNSQPSIRWTRELEQLPTEFIRTIPASVELDRKAVLKALKDETPLPDGFEVKRGRHVVIQ